LSAILAAEHDVAQAAYLVGTEGRRAVCTDLHARQAIVDIFEAVTIATQGQFCVNFYAHRITASA